MTQNITNIPLIQVIPESKMIKTFMRQVSNEGTNQNFQKVPPLKLEDEFHSPREIIQIFLKWID
jgi:hypothetical protein